MNLVQGTKIDIVMHLFLYRSTSVLNSPTSPSYATVSPWGKGRNFLRKKLFIAAGSIRGTRPVSTKQKNLQHHQHQLQQSITTQRTRDFHRGFFGRVIFFLAFISAGYDEFWIFSLLDRRKAKRTKGKLTLLLALPMIKC